MEKDTSWKITEFIWEIGHDRQVGKAISNLSTNKYKNKDEDLDTSWKITKFIWEIEHDWKSDKPIHQLTRTKTRTRSRIRTTTRLGKKTTLSER